MLEFTYDEVTGRLWSDHFEGFCEGLRDLCDLKLDVQRSSVSMATYFQEYTIDGKLHGVERDDLPKFLTEQGVANDETKTRANPSNWIVYLTEQEGMVEKFERLHKESIGSKHTAEKEVFKIVDEVFEEIEETLEDIVDVEEQEGDAGNEQVSKEEETSGEESAEETAPETVVTEEIIEKVVTVEVVEEVEELQPDFEYIKSLQELPNGEDTLKEYAKGFGVEVKGKNFKGCYISFCNKWKNLQKDKAKG